ncbi:terminase small subunit [Fodinibius sp. SL11]|uniref:terminase small subunit n=1 Tax=Fodinibius sp. SL11 TaxID=3425690 RepID=UPI003F883FCA
MSKQCQATTAKGEQCQNTAQEGSDYCWIESHGEGEEEQGLTPKQERFCQLYVSEEFFGNGTQSYAKAYDVDLSENYKSAQAAASRLLSNVIICDRINELLDEAGLNDNFVDKQMLFMITQNADYAQKMAAIREYNKVKGRITNKHDIKSGGEPVKGLTFNVVNGSSDNE